MARISEVYAGRYISGAELGAKRRQAVIIAVEVAIMGQGDKPTEQVVLSLKSPSGKAWPRQFTLNKSNAHLLSAAFGDDTRDWPGRTIEVWAEPVMYQGKLVAGKKVMPLQSQETAIAAASHGGIPDDEPDTGTSNLAADLDDEIPF